MTVALPPSTAPAGRPLRVATRGFTVVDPTRPTVSHGRRVSGDRTIPVTVVRPSAGRWPLVVFAHGFNVEVSTYLHLIDAIAAAGYVVAAPTFPLEHAGAGADLDEGDLDQQPGDVRAVIAEIDRRSGTNDPAVGGAVDLSRIALVGHSDGAETVLGAGFQAPLDPRVRAVAALSGGPPGGPMIGSTPLLVAQGDADPINPPAEADALFAQAPGPKAYLRLLGAGHLPPMAEPTPWRPVVERCVVDFLDAELGAGEGFARLRTDGTVAGLASVTTVD